MSIDYLEGKEKVEKDYLDLLIRYQINAVICQDIREDLMNLLSQTPEGIIRINCYHTRPFYDQSFVRQEIRYYRYTSFKEFCYYSFCWVFPKYFAGKLYECSLRDWERSFSASTYVCLLSERYFDRLLKLAPFAAKEKLIAINNPNSFIDTDIDKIWNKEKVILWVGRHINSPKNFPLFIDFWKQFKKRHTEWKAIVLGEGIDWETNKRYADRKKAIDVEFLGNKQNVDEYYNRSSFIMITSYYEGWSMVLVEAMSRGCIPCVYNTFEALLDIVDDEVNGVVLPPFEIDVAVKRISSIINDVALMDRMRTDCRRKANSFDVKNILKFRK